jgi:hypothetical protein
MDGNNANSLMFETLDNIRKIGTPSVSMWALNDKYSSPPYFKFRFEDTPSDDAIYKVLHEIIEEFKGSLQWEIIHDEKKSSSFFILPKAFASFIFKDNFVFEKQSFLVLLSQAEYESTIDKAIIDVPNLAEYIVKQYKARGGASN